MKTIQGLCSFGSEKSTAELLGKAFQAIEGLSRELDRTRAERDQLRAQELAADRKANLAEGA